MAERAREILGLTPGLLTTVLIDNRADNIGEFLRAGGQAIHDRRDTGCLDQLADLVP